MLDASNPQPNSPDPDGLPKQHKRLGHYLMEAGLISAAQLAVALQDQQCTQYPLGEILVLRGWVKQSVIDLVVQKLQLITEESELRVVIRPGQSAAQGVIQQDGQKAIVSSMEDLPLNFLEEDTLVHERSDLDLET